MLLAPSLTVDQAFLSEWSTSFGEGRVINAMHGHSLPGHNPLPASMSAMAIHDDGYSPPPEPRTENVGFSPFGDVRRGERKVCWGWGEVGFLPRLYLVHTALLLHTFSYTLEFSWDFLSFVRVVRVCVLFGMCLFRF